MADPVSIVNQALLMLGQNTIRSLEEQTKEAEIAGAFYADALDHVLKDIKPSFARRRAVPSALPGSVPPPYSYQYQVPPDCLLIVSATSGDVVGHWQWEVEGATILSDQSVGQISYIARIPGVEAYMDGSFVQAFSAYLAMKYAYAIMGDANRSNQLIEVYRYASGEAMAVEGQQGSSRRLVNDALIARR
jgi:hypothetical protein